MAIVNQNQIREMLKIAGGRGSTLLVADVVRNGGSVISESLTLPPLRPLYALSHAYISA
ncbi:MAG TPA: hypothetical protein VEE84_01545 [Burkholderiaceae bacterium]|nr:hypothetical protein [Burkholderiaceae bacterium]